MRVIVRGRGARGEGRGARGEIGGEGEGEGEGEGSVQHITHHLAGIRRR